MSEQTPRGLTFGSVAERYERYRPGYVDAVDLLLESEPESALEVGAGTGKATRAVAGRGVRVTAVEPDPGMCAVLDRTTSELPVTIVRSTFEELSEQPPVDLLYSAAAWHWTEASTRWERAAAVIRPGGSFVCLGGPIDVADPQLSEEIERMRVATLGDENHSGARNGDDGTLWPGNELAQTPLFDQVRTVPLPTTFPMPADDLVGLMSTVSGFLVQTESVRGELLARIRAMLPDPVEVRRDLTVHLARRVDSVTRRSRGTSRRR